MPHSHDHALPPKPFEHQVSGYHSALVIVDEIANYCKKRGENLRYWTRLSEELSEEALIKPGNRVRESLGHVYQRVQRGEVFIMVSKDMTIPDFTIDQVLAGKVQAPTRPRPLSDNPWNPRDVAENIYDGGETNAAELLRLLHAIEHKYLEAHQDEAQHLAMATWAREMERKIHGLQHNESRASDEDLEDLRDMERLIRRDLVVIAERVRNHQKIESTMFTPASLFPDEEEGLRDADVLDLFNAHKEEDKSDFFLVSNNRNEHPSFHRRHNGERPHLRGHASGGSPHGASQHSLGRISLRTARRVGFVGATRAVDGGYDF
ncbi:hypothetical protein JCM10212_006173 [Sporobolomyces blumeae]